MGKIIYLGGYKMNLQNEKEPVVNVAKWFLQNNSSIDSDSGDGNLKLQKLLYYAQCMYISVFDTTLYPNAIEAWENGPVVREAYTEYRHNDLGTIARKEEPIKLDAFKEDVLRVVNIIYGAKSATELIELTHAEGPWKDLRELAEKRCDPIITVNAIKNYYKECFRDIFNAFREYVVKEYQYRSGNNIFIYQEGTNLTDDDKKSIDDIAYDMNNQTLFVSKDKDGGLVIY